MPEHLQKVSSHVIRHTTGLQGTWLSIWPQKWQLPKLIWMVVEQSDRYLQRKSYTEWLSAAILGQCLPATAMIRRVAEVIHILISHALLMTCPLREC